MQPWWLLLLRGGRRSLGTKETLGSEKKLHVEIVLQNLVPAFAVGPQKHRAAAACVSHLNHAQIKTGRLEEVS